MWTPHLPPLPLPLRISAPNVKRNESQNAILSVEELPPNALRRKRDPHWRGGFSLGLDLGLARTGLALSKGFSVRPLTVTLTLTPYFCLYYRNIEYNRKILIKYGNQEEILCNISKQAILLKCIEFLILYIDIA